MAWLKVFGCGFADGGAVKAACASDALLAFERRLTYIKLATSINNKGRYNADLLADALPEILEALSDVGWVVVGLIGVLTRGGQHFLVSCLQRINANLKLDIVVWQLRLLGSVASLLLEPLLTTGRKGRHSARDRRGEGLKLVHGGSGVDVDWG